MKRHNHAATFCCSLLIALLLGGCAKKSYDAPPAHSTIVIAGEGDVDSFNPLFAEEITAGEINDLLFPSLVRSEFDTVAGQLQFLPSLAESWQFSSDRRDITFHLRTDARWSDGTPVTARDVQFSFELYADTVVASVRQSSTQELIRGVSGEVSIREAVEIVDDSTVIFHFSRAYPGQLYDAGLPLVPYHQVHGIDRAALRGDSTNRFPLSAGPFMLRSWEPMQQLELVSNPQASLHEPARVDRIIYRILPDYATRIHQLKSGDVDIVPYVRVRDAADLQRTSSDIAIGTLGERFYDAVNWNNIDPKVFLSSSGKVVKPHPLFGDREVRKALTLAINRDEIVQSYLAPYGRVSFGPISPIFKSAYDARLDPLPFDPVKASELLESRGWRDTDGDGNLDKDGKTFSFTLRITAGDEMRGILASIIQAQLRQVRIEVRIEQVERSTFWGDLMEKKYDAWISGFSVPLQLQLYEFWGSDLKEAPLNLVSYQNERVDAILRKARRIEADIQLAAEWREFQEILHRDQPCTFLYWMNDLVAYNRRVQGARIGAMGLLYHAAEWTVAPAAAGMSR